MDAVAAFTRAFRTVRREVWAHREAWLRTGRWVEFGWPVVRPGDEWGGYG